MNSERVRIHIVGEPGLVTSSLALALGRDPGLAVMGVSTTIDDLSHPPASAQLASVDVVVLDFDLPRTTGIDVLHYLGDRHPQIRVVVLSALGSPDALRQAVEAGCIAFLHKSSELSSLVRAVTAAAVGQASFDADALRIALSTSHDDPIALSPSRNLSDREREILRLIAGGLNTETIAAQLYLSQHTVRNHVRNLTAKLGAHSRLEAVAIAARNGLIALVDSP